MADEPHPPVSSIDPPPDTPRRRARRYARRVVAVVALAGGLYLGYAYALEPVLRDDGGEVEQAAPAGDGGAAPADPEAQPEPPPRPEGVPARIPDWAWELNEWHSTPGAERGPRPESAPRTVPAWYWEWRAWREELTAAGET